MKCWWEWPAKAWRLIRIYATFYFWMVFPHRTVPKAYGAFFGCWRCERCGRVITAEKAKECGAKTPDAPATTGTLVPPGFAAQVRSACDALHRLGTSAQPKESSPTFDGTPQEEVSDGTQP